ncbi:MAG: pyruvate kinase [Endomicrobiales bacterium]|nr:pyruvate kinase [Endomicrobiales bacterium]
MKTKIICTIGPSSHNPPTLKKMILEGMSIARINLSHMQHKDIKSRLNTIQRASSETGRKIRVFADLQGPKIRIGYFNKNSIFLKENSTFTITTDNITGSASKTSVDYKELPRYVKKNEQIFLADGKIELKVISVSQKSIKTKVITGGEISHRKGLSVKNKNLPLPGITEKDRKDLEFCIETGITWYAHSFVRKAEHVEELRDLLKHLGIKRPYIIAKIEDSQGFKNIDSIIKVSDSIMIARGDLGVSVDRAIVPIIQKSIINKCNKAGKPEIVATQMLQSMVYNPTPTRSEVNDVAVSVMQGADYLMLSDETTIGKYPVRAVKEMRRIIWAVEKYD